MQTQLPWGQPTFNSSQQPGFRNDAAFGPVAASSNFGSNASGSSTGGLSGAIFASPVVTSAPQNAQQGSGSVPTSTVVSLEAGSNDNGTSLAQVPRSIPSTGSTAEDRPNGENTASASPGPKPVLKMKRTGQNVPLSSELYRRTNSHSPSQFPGPFQPKNANKVSTSVPVNIPAVPQPENQPVGSVFNADIPKPGVEGLTNGPPPGASEPSSLHLLESRSADALNGAPSLDEHSDGDIKYEDARPVGFDDAAEGGASENESSDGESSSGSEGDGTIENSELPTASFQQLFRPPGLESGSDDEDYSDSEDDEEEGEEASASERSSADPETDDQSPVTESATNALPQVSFPSTVLTEANASRPYTQVLDHGLLLKAGPAIFPDGYEKCTTPEAMGNPWICPVRSCRRCFKTLHGLSNHARFAHKRCLMNDNMDGTLSIVATYTQKNSLGRNPPLVVSKRPLDPSEPPMVKPSLQPKDLKSLKRAAAKTLSLHPGRERKQLRPPRGHAVPKATTKLPKAVTAAAEPGPRLRVYAPSEIKPIEMASKDRTYKVITGPDGEAILTCGALLPNNYKQNDSTPGHPWICPLRSCRYVFARIQSLGSHFVRQHHSRLLNDNLDGTLSEVGSYDTPMPGLNSLPALVISQTSLGPSAGPIAEPKISAQYKDPKEKEILSRPSPPQSSTATIATEESFRSFWDYLLPYLPASYALMPSDPEMARLLDLPRQRVINWRDQRVQRRLDDNRRQVLALILHVVGNSARAGKGHDRKSICTNCLKGLGPFKGCQHLPSKVSLTGLRCCANCMFDNNQNTCIPARWGGHHGIEPRKRQLSDPGVDHGADSAAGRRRSERLHFPDDATPVEGPSRKMVKLSLKSRTSSAGWEDGEEVAAAGKRATSRRREDDARRSLITGAASTVLHAGQVEPDHFEMEEWEIAPGHIEEAGVGQANNLAFSKPFLERHQAVQISPDLSFRVETVRSGHTAEIAPDARNTRYCSVASGKVRVSMSTSTSTPLGGGNSSEEAKGQRQQQQQEFTIGTHGLFKIMPGARARVQNRLYFDAVLHVSTYLSW